ncbi:MAG TPA: DUF3426 domain-containing protein [Caulobacteraceae bacterium]
MSLRRRWREAAFTGATVGAAAVVLGLVVGAAVIFRDSVVRSVPGSAGAYAAIGLPVNRVGLVIEAVRAEPALQDGHVALAVFGVIRNIVDRPVASPPLRLALYDGAGRRLAGRIATAPGLRIPAGARRRFAVAILDPPMAAANLEVGFAPGAVRGPLARTFSAPPPPPAGPLALKGPIEPPSPPSPAANAQS